MPKNEKEIMSKRSTSHSVKKLTIESRGLSPRVNYTDLATAACRRS
jgi:hypothetical protein